MQDPNSWNSLVINRRKPHTYRAWKMLGNDRVCVHKFDPCEPDDCFVHPHPWPAAFLILDGKYIQNIGYSKDLTDKDPTMIYREVLTRGSMYEMDSPTLWHSVQPLTTTYTIMLNGEPWDAHESTRRTKGKDLDEMSHDELLKHLQKASVHLRSLGV